MGNFCQSCGNCFGKTKETPNSTFQPAANRGCTDILFLLLFIASFGGMLAVILVATGKGASPQRIYHGVDLKGNVCGGAANENKPYNAWIAMPSPNLSPHNGNVYSRDCTDCFYIKTCVTSCNQTQRGPDAAPEMIDFYVSEDFGYFCVPDTSVLVDGSIKVSFSFSGDFATVQENASRAIGDLYTVWPLILGSAAVALLFSFLYNFLSETYAGVLVFFAIVILLAGGILSSYTLIKAGKEARDSNTATNRSDAMLGLGITIAICTAVFVIVVIAMRERIRLAIEIVKEANRCVHDIWSLIIFPIFPMIAGLGYIAFWVVVAVYIFAVWTTKSETLPEYVTESPQFYLSDGVTVRPVFHELLNTTSGKYEYFSYTWDQSMQNVFAYVFFHLLWTSQFVIYFSYMVMAGTVAQWYFAPMDANEKRITGNNPGELSYTPITDSCGRTCRFHIGTVALAALLIATVMFIRACVLYVERQLNKVGGNNIFIRCGFCMIHCFLACLQCCLDKINKNALVWTAIWGDSFGTASCSSFKMLWGNMGRTGAMSVVAFFLMFLGKILIALATTGFAGIFLRLRYPDISSPVLPMVVVFIIAFMVGSLFMSVFEVAMDTVFLCFLIDEKLHAASGTMCASKGLRKLVDSDHMRAKNQLEATKQREIQEKRCKQLGLGPEQQHGYGTANAGGANTTGVAMQPMQPMQQQQQGPAVYPNQQQYPQQR